MTNGRAAPVPANTSTTARAWSVDDASELYEVARWGNGYFSVNPAGHVQVHPSKDSQRAIDLKELVDRLQLRGISLPVLLRFTDILKHRLATCIPRFRRRSRSTSTRVGIAASTRSSESAAAGRRGVLQVWPPYKFGLEAGSKPELLAVVAVADNETRSSATASGRRVHRDGDAGPEDGPQHHPRRREYTELALILDAAGKIACARRSACGSSWRRWQRALAVLGIPVEVRPDRHRNHARPRRAEDPRMEDCFKLLHFHLGSQITNIRIVKGALNEGPVSTRSWRSWAPGCSISMSAASGRGLRDRNELRVEHELHARGIRQRRCLPHSDGVRRGGRPASTIVVRERTRDRGVPQRARVQRAWGLGLRATRRCRPANPDWNSRSWTSSRPTTTSTRARARGFPRRPQALDMALSLFNGGLPAARAAQHGREPVLAICTKLQKIVQTMADVPKTCRISTSSCLIPTSATSPCSSRFPTAGRSSNFSR